MRNFLHEFRCALRSLRRQPAFFLVILGIIALTVGTNGLIYGLVRGVLLSPLPYEQPDDIVVIWEENPQQGSTRSTVSWPNFEDWRRQVRSFAGLAAWKHEEDVLTGGEPERLVGATVTSDFFPVLGVQPLLGRAFSREEEDAEIPVVLISERLWRRCFGASPEILGTPIELDGASFTLIGVLPGGFDRPIEPLFNRSDFWRPMVVDPPRGTRFLQVVGRLAGPAAAAETELTGIARELAAQHPEDEGWTVSLIPLHAELVRTVRPILQILFIAANVVLLIGCTNLANILLARAASRKNEIALRLSLGATRGRLFSLFAAESLVLVLPGSLLGALLAALAGKLLLRGGSQFLPRVDEINLGGPVLKFSLLLALLITLATALLVVAQVSRLDLGKSVAEMGRRAGADRGTRRMREALAVVQVVLTFPLLVSTVVLIKSVQKLEGVALGFEPRNVVAGEIILPDSRYGEPHSQAEFFRQLLENLQSAPGVEARSAVSDLPLSEWSMGMDFLPAGMHLDPEDKKPFAQFRIVAPDYFQTLGIRQARGRDFAPQDRSGGEPVVIVNDELVRRYFQNRNPLGERLAFDFGERVEARIVGVVGDVRHKGPTDILEPTIYVSYLQFPSSRMTVLVCSESGTAALAATLRRQIQSLDNGLPPAKLIQVESLYQQALAGPRLRAMVLGLFGGLALSLTALGIYGVVSFSAAIRRHEIGVRMALGAQRREILWMILRHGTFLCLWGILGGAVLGFLSSGLLANHVYGVRAVDAGTWIVIASLLLLIGVTAGLKPAAGALRPAPSLVLKND
jgi:putative ABC transport system permease protein